MIADDTYLIREALDQIVGDSQRIDVVGTYGDRDTLLQAIDASPPDAVITDIRMPPTGTDEGIQVAQSLRERHPRIGVVVLSQYTDPGYVMALLEAGSSGRAYLLKERISDPGRARGGGGDRGRRRLGGGPQGGRGAGQGSNHRRRTRRCQPSARASTRCSRNWRKARAMAPIAESLVLTRRAVEKHINSIFMKLELPGPEDVSRRVTAALMFLSAGEKYADE